jgi:hypothetical protein
MVNFTVATPINKNIKSNSNVYYREQKDREKKGEQMMWDDVKGNPTKKSGGFFVFVHNYNFVVIHIVLDIIDQNNRLKSWSKNVGQGDRNVLYLSNPIIKMSWENWIHLKCPKKVQGTQNIKSAHENLTNYLKKYIEYIPETKEIILKKKYK